MTNQLEESSAKARKPDKREAIIEAARALFTTQGYEATTIADVAKKAGIAVGTVYLYFKNKPELLYAVKGDWEQQMVERMLSPELSQLPHHERLGQMVLICFEICAQKTEMAQMMSLPPQMVGEMHGQQPKNSDHLNALLAQFFAEGIEAGSFRPVDPKMAAVLTFGVVIQALYQCFELEQGHNQSRYIQSILDLFSHWLISPALRNSAN